MNSASTTGLNHSSEAQDGALWWVRLASMAKVKGLRQWAHGMP